MRRIFSIVDILISPSCFETAPPIDQPLDEGYRPKPRPRKRGLSQLGAAGNLAGLPALSVPCGFAGNLPVALQIVGRPFIENDLIAVGVAFQKVTDWHLKRPPHV